MSPGQVALEDFSLPLADKAGAPEVDVDVADLEARVEAARSEGYESGYKTGWDDAVRTAREDGTALGEEMSRNLRDLRFTYFEAREELMTDVRAFLRELVDAMFPALLSEAAAATLTEALSGTAENALTGEIALAVSPDDAPTVRTLLPLPDGTDLSLVEEPALLPGQARLRVAEYDYTVDADRIVSMIRATLAAPERDDPERKMNG